jgi:hypothetical protein
MKKKITSATQLLNNQIEIPCYLCGKGKIVMQVGLIMSNQPHPIDYKVRIELEKYLMGCAKKWIDDLWVK